MKIGVKLFVILIVLNLFSIGTVGTVLLVRSRANISTLARDYTAIMAKDSGGVVEQFLGESWYTAETVAQVMDQYENIIPEKRRELYNIILEGIVANNPHIIGAWCVWEADALEGNDRAYIGTPGTAPNGRFVPYWLRQGGKVQLEALVDYDVPGKGNYYLITKKSGITTLLDPYISEAGGAAGLITTVSTPIRSPDGKLAGIVGINISIDPIQEISQSIKPYDDALTAVFSNNGTIVAHFDPSRIGKDMWVTEQDMTGIYMSDFVDAIKTGKQYTFSNYIEQINENMELYAVPIKIGESTTPWSFAIGIMTKTVMKPVNDMMIIAVFISVLMLVIMTVSAILLARSISKPIVKVADTLKDISEGEGDLTRLIQEKGRDEITDLAHYFNLTIKKIKNLIINIKQQAVSLSDIGSNLSSNMTETAAAINEITSNIQSIKGRVLNQSASVTETNATMEQITANIDKLDDHVKLQASSVAQSSSAIEEMLANIQSVTNTLIKNASNVKELMEASELGRTGLEDVAADIQEIARESEGLLEINSVMENISSQTNLLSMNAAIEAAHAGDAGKGFAVVADEIRKLAESSSEQSKTISTVLKKIKESIDKITVSTDNVIKKFEAIDTGVRTVADQEGNIRSAMEEQGEGSKQVLEAIGKVNEITQEVRSETAEMFEGSKEVIHETENLENVTQEITGGMNEMAAGADQINVAVNKVNDLSDQNREKINLLVGEVSRFKVE